jgi:hypothetical protein
MNRWGRAVILFLVLGAVVNVAVAWGIVFIARHLDLRQESTSLVEYTGVPIWRTVTLTAAGVTGVASEVVNLPNARRFVSVSDNIPAWSRASRSAADALTVDPTFELASGWPARSLMCSYNQRTKKTVDALHWSQDFEYGFPLRPIWPGFLANTAFYAVSLWLLFLGSGTVRRSLRRHRGRCPACGYDLRGTAHERCPECGNCIRRAEPVAAVRG